MFFKVNSSRLLCATALSLVLSIGTSKLYAIGNDFSVEDKISELRNTRGNAEAKKFLENLVRTSGDRKLEDLISDFLSAATKDDDEILKTYAEVFLQDKIGYRNYGYAARLYLKRSELEIVDAKDDFYNILVNFHKLDTNYRRREAQALYPICLEEIRKGDQKTKQLVEQNYT
ncbi:MAG: hypothetical protein K2X08_03540, partial [Chlamydiales bacterium]|nr:hypothetical protein [Chlamydiales bacterium]